MGKKGVNTAEVKVEAAAIVDGIRARALEFIATRNDTGNPDAVRTATDEVTGVTVNLLGNMSIVEVSKSLPVKYVGGVAVSENLNFELPYFKQDDALGGVVAELRWFKSGGDYKEGVKTVPVRDYPFYGNILLNALPEPSIS